MRAAMSTARRLRAAVLAGLALALLVATAAPALAHGRGTDATNFRSRVLSAPPVEGLTWRVYGGDELLWAENTSGRELIVLDYQREPRPYVRITAEGVWRNRNSPATYLNQDRYGQVAVPAGLDPAAEPDWERVSDQPRFIWHDHRIHWMSPSLPPMVRQDPGREVVVDDEWRVPVLVDGRPAAVTGELRWVPGPAVAPWLALGLALSLPALAGWRSRPADGRWPGLARPAAAVLAAVTVAGGVFLLDDLLAVPLPATTAAFAAAQTALFLALGMFGAVRGWQERDGAFTALGVGSAALLIGQGLLLAPVLGASQLATVFPDALPRAVVGVSIVQALPVGAVALIGNRRLLAEPAAESPEPVRPAPSGRAD